MTFPIFRHMNMVLTVTLGKKELEENIFMFVWCLRKLCKKSDLFTLDINSGGFINQFYQNLDTQFWYTIFLHLSSMNFIEKKKSGLFCWSDMKPPASGNLFKKQILSQVSE